jgi:hypothetical protein
MMLTLKKVAAASVLLMAPVGAMAQGAAVRQACGPELQQHCAGIEPGEGRLRTCVKENFTAFSEPCKQAMLSSVAVVRACKADVQRTCPDIQPGGEYSESCKQAIITAKFDTR